MEITIKEISKEVYIEPSLLILNQVEERLDTKRSEKKITWTDQFGTERELTALTDAHAANLAPWLRDRGFILCEQIIQAELERRCTESYPDNFNALIQLYKSRPETWRMKVH